jgi:hypothetical protein
MVEWMDGLIMYRYIIAVLMMPMIVMVKINKPQQNSYLFSQI